ncbi:MAG TPA: ribonucleotide-diphosphate reductase subunit beta [Thermoanaerobaculia bacterium]|nr:ribonucleotide-diphosphate reductase subunit beta [Thermoanaerobaculia bacterium]
MPLDFDSLPMHLFQRSQQRMWQPSALDYSKERAHWMALDDRERELLLRLVSGFLVGERGVTHELAPLQQALRRQRGWMEEEMYLTAQLFEEAKHVEFFQRWLNAALPGVFGRDIPYPDLQGDLFSERLPAAMQALWQDDSDEAKVRAIVTYHQYVEGVGAEASYPIFFDLLGEREIFPALHEGIQLVRRDEARHIAFGVYLLQRLLERDPSLRSTWESELASFSEYIDEGPLQTFAPFGSDVPFGLDPEKYRALFREKFEEQRRAIDERVLV